MIFFIFKICYQNFFSNSVIFKYTYKKVSVTFSAQKTEIFLCISLIWIKLPVQKSIVSLVRAPPHTPQKDLHVRFYLSNHTFEICYHTCKFFSFSSFIYFFSSFSILKTLFTTGVCFFSICVFFFFLCIYFFLFAKRINFFFFSSLFEHLCWS